jgi:hypothetical protein
VRLRFLGRDPGSPNNGSPTIYETDTGFLVQGWIVTDPEALAQLGDLPAGETIVEIPRRMLRFFPQETGDPGESVR